MLKGGHRFGETHGVEQHQVMVAQQRPDPAASGSRLFFQPHDQLDHAHAAWSTVGVIAQKPEPGVRSRPVQPGVCQMQVLEQGDELFQMPVNISDDERGHAAHSISPALLLRSGPR